MQYAKDIEQSYIVINSITGKVEENINEGRIPESLEKLDAYNREELGDEELETFARKRFAKYTNWARDAKLQISNAQLLQDDLMLKYARASLLSKRFQGRYLWAVMSIYILAPLVVAAVALQLIMFPDMAILIVFELVFIALIFLFVLPSNHFKWHNKWIDYRFMTERLRVAVALSAVGIEDWQFKLSPNISLAHQTDYWVVKALGWVWNTQSGLKQPLAKDIEPVKKFLLSAWIKNQYNYYEDNSIKYENKHSRTYLLGMGLFIITGIAALAHYPLEGRLDGPGGSTFLHILVLIGIIFPAVGASLAGIQVHREYHRNADRYHQMLDPLRIILKEIEKEKDLDKLMELLESANELMLHENQDWRVSILSQTIEV